MSTRPSWTQEEKEFLIENYYEISPEEISLRLNRNVQAIKNMASNLGLNNTVLKNNHKAVLKIKYNNDIIHVASVASIDNFLSALRITYNQMRPAFLRGGKIVLEIEI